ncbi:MAG: DUF4198 domain-containing protein [Gemmatimonadales bacterium]|nr:DUF4198 domain-containing protein [Gemmatimonadales bacterium]
MRPRSLTLTAAALAVAVGVAAAHDTWLVPAAFAVRPGATVVLAMSSGDRFPADGSAIRPERIADATLRLGGATTPITDRVVAGGHLRLRARVATAGVATLAVSLAPRDLDMDSTRVSHYLDEIGAGEAIRAAWAAMPAPRAWRESYAKHVKTFVAVGAARDSSWREPVGQALELVPLAHPLALRAGDTLRVRLLRGGTPLAGAAVGAAREGARHATLVPTGPDGVAALPLPRAGRWLLRATDLRLPAGPDARWTSDFTTLVIAVRAKAAPPTASRH